MGVLIDRDDTASVTAIHTELTRQAKTAAGRTRRHPRRPHRPPRRPHRGVPRRRPQDPHPGRPHPTAPPRSTGGARGEAPAGSAGARTPAVDGDGSRGSDTTDAAAARQHRSANERRYRGGRWSHRYARWKGTWSSTWPPCAAKPSTRACWTGPPIPAPMGRELARAVRAWRRIVTDPVTGHLLDYGRRVYLPPALVTFIHARDGQCTAPYCQRRSSRCQMDHRTPVSPRGRRTPRTAATCATATTPSRPTAT